MKKKEIKKIKFVGFPGPLDINTSYTCKTLKDDYDFVISDNPDYLIYSCFGREHIKYDCIKIYFTAECITPDFNLCDYAIAFDRLNFGDRYYRMPLYALYTKEYMLSKTRHNNAEKIASEDRDFCSFTVSNRYGMKERKLIFDILNTYKHVDSGGSFLNNTGGKVKDKFSFDSKHKFSIAFENCQHPGYITEKIIQAFGAGCIPIYLGASDVSLDFNPKAFVNCHDFKSLDECLDYVKEIDNDDSLYLDMLKQPVFNFEDNLHQGCHNFLKNIFSQDLKSASRRPNNTWMRKFTHDVDTLRKNEMPLIRRFFSH